MKPYEYSVEQIESRLAFADVIAGYHVDAQTAWQPDAIRRLRQLNPNAVIMPYRISEEQMNLLAPLGAGISLEHQFLEGVRDDWYVKDTKGNYLVEFDFPKIRFMNISSFAPVIGGQTFFSYLQDWLRDSVFRSGLWDGISFDNLFARVNTHIPTAFQTDLFDFDYNRTGFVTKHRPAPAR